MTVIRIPVIVGGADGSGAVEATDSVTVPLPPRAASDDCDGH